MTSRFRIFRQKENKQRLKYVLMKEIASFGSRKDAELYLKEERLKEKSGARILQMRAGAAITKFESKR